MKAIETIWKGYRFRSRTEARWAVFLEALGVRFEYEAEGFVLPSGPYLPDFKLTAFPEAGWPAETERETVWLEVKGGEPTEREMDRCAELSGFLQAPVLLAVGAPDWAPQVFLFEPDVPDGMRALMAHGIDYLTFVDIDFGAGPAVSVGRPARTHADQSDDPEFRQWWDSLSGPYGRVLGAKGVRWVNKTYPVSLSDRTRKAFDAARGARFEFGQTDPRWPKA